MKRYVTRAWWFTDYDEDDHHQPKGMMVFELEPESVPTGILDKDGNMIISVWATDPIGFIHHKEKE